MKKIILGCFVSLIVSNTFAKPPHVSEDQHEENCKSISAFAYMAMGARQNGTTLSEALDIANGITDRRQRDIGKKIVVDAYKQTKYASQEYKDNARSDFADKYMLSCMEMYKNSNS
ncbi:hypothetical protein OZX61_07285 [Acinetobacter sp. ESL0695]|uniref:hypothetical protein n=1 Tax=Acinetobacter sp. ESL0695 TaxID=2983215 RepID=UPI0023F512AE|nr:hypothetical protein [Acinetobacter sp. ESL0695]WEV48092.1 hypothetical protein OZX61_07285 [Acinetobacter sp. ESL0695]